MQNGNAPYDEETAVAIAVELSFDLGQEEVQQAANDATPKWVFSCNQQQKWKSFGNLNGNWMFWMEKKIENSDKAVTVQTKRILHQRLFRASPTLDTFSVKRQWIHALVHARTRILQTVVIRVIKLTAFKGRLLQQCYFQQRNQSSCNAFIYLGSSNAVEVTVNMQICGPPKYRMGISATVTWKPSIENILPRSEVRSAN